MKVTAEHNERIAKMTFASVLSSLRNQSGEKR